MDEKELVAFMEKMGIYPPPTHDEEDAASYAVIAILGGNYDTVLTRNQNQVKLEFEAAKRTNEQIKNFAVNNIYLMNLFHLKFRQPNQTLNSRNILSSINIFLTYWLPNLLPHQSYKI